VLDRTIICILLIIEHNGDVTPEGLGVGGIYHNIYALMAQWEL